MMGRQADEDRPSRTGKRRVGRPLTPEELERQALEYVARFSTSAANLRRVLRRKVERSARLHGTDREAGLAAVDRLLERLTGSGIVDDGRYAEGRAATLFRRGASRRMIAARLAEKGVGEAEIAAALASLDELVAEPDLVAALAYARRRRLGPYRDPAARAAYREKDLAALGRAGFSLDLALQVVDAADIDVRDGAA